MISFRPLGFAGIVALAVAVGGCCAPAPGTMITAAWNVNCPGGCAAVNNNYTLSGTLGQVGTFDAYGSCSVGTSGGNRVLNVQFTNDPATPHDHGIYIFNAVFPSISSPASTYQIHVYFNGNEYLDDQTSGNCRITVASINGTTVAGTYECTNIMGIAGGPLLNVCANGDIGCTRATTGTFSVSNCAVN